MIISYGTKESNIDVTMKCLMSLNNNNNNNNFYRDYVESGGWGGLDLIFFLKYGKNKQFHK